MVPGMVQFFYSWRWPGFGARSAIGLPAQPGCGGRFAGRRKQKIDTAPKEVYKQFVDICLTDFCYPRV
jgi:hypothetical protein